MKKDIPIKIILILISATAVMIINLYHLFNCEPTDSILYIILDFILMVIIILSTLKILKKIKDREINRIKASFLSNISHEIKTPLNGIMGMNNLLKNTKLTTEQLEYTQIINSCGESLLTTINDLLDYSKIENDQLHIESIGFDLRKLINDFYNINKLQAEVKELKFDYEIDYETPTHYIGDPGRIRQILSNLYNNSVKFTSEGSIHLSCEQIEESESHSTIKFNVKDSGIGISSKKINGIFKGFTQGNSSISKEYKGIGLGLTISKQLVALMDGNIGVYSHEGIGTDFWFTIRLKRDALLRKPKSLADASQTTALIVKSTTIEMKEIEEKLHSNSIKVTMADTFKHATEKLADTNFDFIIFDINISSTESITLESFTQFCKERTNSSLITLTAEGKRGDGELCRKLSIDGYLVTPFSDTALIETISLIYADDRGAELITVHSLLENRKSRVKVLIVDDNKVNLMVAQKLLLKMGFHSEAVLSGEEALIKLEKEVFDLVFMDLQMPGMSGIQTTAAIRDEKSGYKNRNVPIVALTANTTATDRLSCSQVGMDGFLTKPYQPKLLEESINRFVKWNVL